MSSPPDLHVAKLHYSLVESNRVSYVTPKPIEFDTADAHFRLADGRLTCAMKIHTSSDTEARAAVEPVIRAWEVASDLKGDVGAFRLKYERPEIVDRAPLSPGENRASIHIGLGMLSVAGSVTVHVTLENYPEPPGEFGLNQDAESMWVRFKGYVEGREPLLSMAYFCQTVLRAVAGNLDGAAKAFAIDAAVLRKIGELTSKRGDRATARKASSTALPPLSGNEAAWLEAAIKAIIFRVGDKRDPRTLPRITSADLPALP